MCNHLDTILDSIPTVKGSMTDSVKKVFNAFSKDMTLMDGKLKKTNEDIQHIRNEVNDVKIEVQKANGKIDSVFELIKSRLDSGVDEDRMIGTAIKSVLRSKKFWFILIGIIALLMLSGISLMYIIENSANVAQVADAASKII